MSDVEIMVIRWFPLFQALPLIPQHYNLTLFISS